VGGGAAFIGGDLGAREARLSLKVTSKEASSLGFSRIIEGAPNTPKNEVLYRKRNLISA
jgi:hypothetical protein